jgi:hypothetical protein
MFGVLVSRWPFDRSLRVSWNRPHLVAFDNTDCPGGFQRVFDALGGGFLARKGRTSIATGAAQRNPWKRDPENSLEPRRGAGEARSMPLSRAPSGLGD